MKMRKLTAGCLVGAALTVAIGAALPADAARGHVVHAWASGRGEVVRIAAAGERPRLWKASLNGKRLEVECLKARFSAWAGITYSLLTPVWAEYGSVVFMRGRLPNGQPRWIGIGAFDGVLVAMAVRSQPASSKVSPSQAPCGFDSWVYRDVKPRVGFLLVA